MVTHASKRDIQNMSQLTGEPGINCLVCLSAQMTVPGDNPSVSGCGKDWRLCGRVGIKAEDIRGLWGAQREGSLSTNVEVYILTTWIPSWPCIHPLIHSSTHPPPTHPFICLLGLLGRICVTVDELEWPRSLKSSQAILVSCGKRMCFSCCHVSYYEGMMVRCHGITNQFIKFNRECVYHFIFLKEILCFLTCSSQHSSKMGRSTFYKVNEIQNPKW